MDPHNNTPYPTARPQRLHEGAVLSGFMWGLMLGSLLMLLRGPRFPWHNAAQLSDSVRQRIETDPVQQALEEGKAEVRRRQAAP